MSRDKEDPMGSGIPGFDWMKIQKEYWEPMTKAWLEASSGFFKPQTSPQKNGQETNRLMRSLQVAFSTGFALFSGMSKSGFMDVFTKKQIGLPEIWMKMVMSGLEGLFDIQKQWIEKAGRIGSTVKAYEFESLDKNFIKVWETLYDKEFRKFFQIPQLGLGRFYQERINETLDAFSKFQSGMGEFLRLLLLPFEKTLQVIQEELQQKAAEGTLPDNADEYYRLWIKILEGHFMTLFKSPEYAETMAGALSSFEDFISARDRVLRDLLQTLPIPSHKDLDELSREIYLLKKRVSVLEKKVK
ncbi:MAG: poly(R)-hydroxyalkanoic acid synthase subunit PhaE [Thermodesulfobacteriota bacterium]